MSPFTDCIKKINIQKAFICYNSQSKLKKTDTSLKLYQNKMLMYLI